LNITIVMLIITCFWLLIDSKISWKFSFPAIM
jgi:hypothetical protein